MCDDEIESPCTTEFTDLVTVETWRAIYRGRTLPITGFFSTKDPLPREPARYQFRP